MKIHIVNADNPVITGRDPGWYFLIFRPNRYEIKKIRGPYGSVGECTRSALAACPSAKLSFWNVQPRIRSWRQH